MNENEIINTNNTNFKTRSIRATEEVLNKFKAVSEHFDNQSDCLEQLITAYEVSNAKAVLSDMRTNIADYESHITAIQKAFLNVLELNQNAEHRIRTEYSLQLGTMQKTIASLQEETEQLKLKSDGFKADYETSIAENDSLKAEISKKNDEILKHNDILSDKNLIISELQDKLSTLNGVIPRNTELNNTVSALQNDLKKADETINSTNVSLVKAEREVEELKRKLAELETKHSEELQTKTAEYEREIAVIKRECDADIKTAIAEERAKNQDKIIELSEKNSQLIERIAQLEKMNATKQ